MGANLSDVSNGGGSRGGGLNNPDCTQDDCFINAARERKKKWWRRRNSRSTDPGRPLREILSNWSIGEVFALVQEYDMMAKEKELYIQCESARPRIQTIRNDLADLLDFKWNSDVNLILPPAIFPAHRAILMQRSKYFRSLLHHQNGLLNMNIEDPVDIPTFSSFIRYLYTEESSAELDNFADTIFNGRPTKGLEVDLRELLQTAKYSDVMLVVGDEHIPCHKSVLSARSAFFRSLFQRRGNSKNLVLDETVIPKRYTRVILHCMYTDRIDLSLIDPARSGLTEVEALTFTGRLNPAGFEEAMELYQIGKFLEFDQLSLLAEDIIVEQLTYESLPAVLRWSSQSYGSSWVRRQAMIFLREEFLNFVATSGFLELDKGILIEMMLSDFLQASEVDILQSILRWGEHQLMKRIEDREPNLLTTTRDSVSRKGIKRRDLSDVELREIIIDLLRLVRTDHILLNHEVLVSAVRRGLVSIPPSHMITEEKTNCWINSSPSYVRPRLYTPFYEEAKSSLRQRATTVSSTCSGVGLVSDHNLTATMGRRLRSIIPDTLYMIEDGNAAVEGCSSQQSNQLGLHNPTNYYYARGYEPLKPGDIVVDPEILSTMMYRLKKLQSAHHRSLNLVSRERASKYLRLRVVREYGFPDYVSEMLDSSLQTNNPVTNDDSSSFGASGVDSSISKSVPQEPSSSCSSSSAINTISDPQNKPFNEQLSGKMPDIALTASSLNQSDHQPFIRLVDDINIMDLDLGDGSASNSSRRSHQSHLHPMPPSLLATASGGTIPHQQPRISSSSAYHRQLSHSRNPNEMTLNNSQEQSRLESRQSQLRENIYTSHYL